MFPKRRTSALYAMKALKDSGLPLKRRVELIISYTEESDWDPFRDFLAKFEPPQLNVAIDAEYPVVVAEKGWGLIQLTLPLEEETPRDGPRLLTLSCDLPTRLGTSALSCSALVSRVPEVHTIDVPGSENRTGSPPPIPSAGCRGRGCRPHP